MKEMLVRSFKYRQQLSSSSRCNETWPLVWYLVSRQQHTFSAWVLLLVGGLERVCLFTESVQFGDSFDGALVAVS